MCCMFPCLPQSLLEEAARCVVHIAAEGWPACDALDELLTSLAYRYTATHFSRCALPKATPTHQQQQGAVVGGLHLPHGVPALLVAKGGRLVGSAPVVRFGGANDIIEDEVVGYLQRLRVLKAPGDTRGTSSSSRGAAGVAAAAAGAAGLRGICSSSDEEQEVGDGREGQRLVGCRTLTGLPPGCCNVSSGPVGHAVCLVCRIAACSMCSMQHAVRLDRQFVSMPSHAHVCQPAVLTLLLRMLLW